MHRPRRRSVAFVVAGLVLVGAVLAERGIFGEDIEHLLRDESGELVPPEGELLPPVRDRAVVWAVGDVDQSPDGRALGDLVQSDRPDRVLYVGDVYDYGNAASFRAWSRDWGRLAHVTAATPGNHDWAEASEGYAPYWAAVHGQPMPSYYELWASGWQILSLNSEADRGSGSEQEKWLARQVESKQGTCRLVFWHRPRYSAGPRGDEPAMDAFWRHLPGHARLQIAGHEHNLQRLSPIRGVIPFVVGAGGRDHASVSSDDPRIAFADTKHTGALRLELEPDRARWQFVALESRTLDSGSTRCQPLRARR
jgi:hypothetical protein